MFFKRTLVVVSCELLVLRNRLLIQTRARRRTAIGARRGGRPSQPTPHVELTASTGQVQVSRYLTACRKEVCTCYTTFQGMLKSTVRILDTLYHLFKHSLARFAHSCVYYIAAGLSKRRKKCPSNSRLLFCARSVMPAPTLTPLISLLFYACSSRG